MFDKKLDKKLEALEAGTARCESLNVDLVQQVKNLQERIKFLEKSSTVTKEDVDKARADYYDKTEAAYAIETAVAYDGWEDAEAAAEAVVAAAWDNYQKLKEAYENGN